ncbi:MAG: hypothetical protein HETSPECPRED_009042 [Heterodermia speciosa]|uniref:Uncharacterized protein n=1 Tax=Heterodermia speciosa TaxID=116794 RepID=A0A8H3G327_9LECA|nr:MAG: hypothetical protein HETSPECPRED_009042 [Heterodermia speciosa]
MPFEGAEKIKHAYIQSFGYILPDPGSLMAEVGFTDQFVVEGAKYTTNKTEIGLRCRDVAQTRAKKGSDFEGRDKTPPLGHPATTYFQGTGDSFELSSKSLTRTSTDEGMQHSRGGRFADFLDEGGGKVINLQSKLLVEWVTDEVKAGGLANA